MNPFRQAQQVLSSLQIDAEIAPDPDLLAMLDLSARSPEMAVFVRRASSFHGQTDGLILPESVAVAISRLGIPHSKFFYLLPRLARLIEDEIPF